MRRSREKKKKTFSVLFIPSSNSDADHWHAGAWRAARCFGFLRLHLLHRQQARERGREREREEKKERHKTTSCSLSETALKQIQLSLQNPKPNCLQAFLTFIQESKKESCASSEFIWFLVMETTKDYQMMVLRTRIN